MITYPGLENTTSGGPEVLGPARRIARDTLEILPANRRAPETCIVGGDAGVCVLCRISLACLRKIARLSESPKSSEPADEKTTT